MAILETERRTLVEQGLERFTARLNPEAPAEPVFIPIPDSPQEQALNSPADVLGYGGSAGSGKALALDTPIPTPDGWRLMGDLRVGDVVFDETGCPTRVLMTTPVMTDHKVYAVEFDDGSVIKADADHLWWTFTDADRNALMRQTPEWRAARRAKRPSRGIGKRPDLVERNRQQPTVTKPARIGSAKTTLEIVSTLMAGKQCRSNHSVRLACPLQLPDCNLPIPPYVLGNWLADGTTVDGAITTPDQEVLDRIASLGYVVRKRPSAPYGYGILGLRKQLRLAGLLGNKHIPPAYLRASEAQRWELLWGLMDGDGTCGVEGNCAYDSTNRTIADGVYELLASLGIKASFRIGRATLYGKDCGEAFTLAFTIASPAFMLTRKRGRQKGETRATQSWRYITAVRELPSEPVRCIAVDSPSHLYLAGRSMIPTHNSFLLLGASMTQHREAIIYRKNFAYLKRLVQDGNRIQAGRCRFVEGRKNAWNTPDGRIVELGAVDYEHQVENYQGQGRDFIGIDEAAQFAESVFRFLTGWLRTDNPNQRARIILTFNPPQDPEGEWIIKYFAPWLDPDHKNPAAPGDLRWYARIEDKDVEVDADWRSTDPMTGSVMKPQSRTFIPGRVTDNPYLMATDYPSQLNMLPEPLRSQLLFGDFTIKAKDNEWQVIGSEAVRAAMKRGRETPKPDLALRALGVDASRGGDDQTVIARVFGNWIAPLLVYPGKDVPDGLTLARLVEDQLTNGEAVTLIDVVGVGTSPYDILRMRKRRVYGVNFGAGSSQKDRTGTLQFANLRAEAYWRAREMLDPNSDWDICLPDDRELLVDLTAPRYNAEGMKIRIEPKDDVKARIGRSPDKGDAVVMLLWGIYRGVGSALKIV